MPIHHYQRAITLLPSATMVISSSGNILATNSAAAKLFGHVESTDLSVFDALNSETHNDTLVYFRHCARTKQPLLGTLHFKPEYPDHVLTCYGAMLEPRSEKNEAVLMLRMEPRNKSNLKFLNLQKEIVDLNKEIASRLDAEYKLKNQTRRLEVTLSSIADAVIITDAKSRIVFLNPTAELQTGWRLKEALGQKVTDIFGIVNELTGASINDIAEKTIQQGEVVSIDDETVLVSKQGERLSIVITSAPIELDNEIEGAIIVFHDVTEKRNLARQLLERANRLALQNKRKNQFLTMLAHELRSPLTPISNAVHLMKLQDNTAQEPRQVIERQVNHLKRLIDDMLDVSRISSGKMKVVKTKIDLIVLIESVYLDFSAQFKRSEIICKTNMPESSIWINADYDRITQVLHNLLNNALKFTPKAGKITLTLKTKDDFAELRVSDTGIGIDKDALMDLFEPFTQAEQTLERSAGGLGLGLSLVKGIVELHGGKVSASSDGLNKGAEICLSLPLANRNKQLAVEPLARNSRKIHRILLIEDDHDAANMMGQLLELLGHEVFCSNTGTDGVIQAKAINPSLVICDIGLPGLDGFGVAKQLRNSASTASIPLVALTGYGESDFVQRAKDAGFDRHITKPASLADIKAALEVTH